MNSSLAFLLLLIGVTVRTDNFIVEAPTKELALEVGSRAEQHRRSISIGWTGKELPTWEVPCLLHVVETEKTWGWFYQVGGRIRGIDMSGPRESIFSHTLPHEITHAVLFTHMGGAPIPRWADEGMAMGSEKDCPHRLHGKWGNRPLDELFRIDYYPEDWQSFYGQSFSVTTFMVETYGRDRFLAFVRDGREEGEWEIACLAHFATTLEDLEKVWVDWHREMVKNGKF